MSLETLLETYDKNIIVTSQQKQVLSSQLHMFNDLCELAMHIYILIQICFKSHIQCLVSLYYIVLNLCT